MAKTLLGELNVMGFTLRPNLERLYAIERWTGSSIALLIACMLKRRRPLQKPILRFLLCGMGCGPDDRAAMQPADARNLPRLDWQDMFRIATGMLGYRPQEFWRMTLTEYALALEGFCLLHNIDAPSATAPATSQELAELLKQFPDGE